jgi:hypothetical protein
MPLGFASSENVKLYVPGVEVVDRKETVAWLLDDSLALLKVTPGAVVAIVTVPPSWANPDPLIVIRPEPPEPNEGPAP